MHARLHRLIITIGRFALIVGILSVPYAGVIAEDGSAAAGFPAGLSHLSAHTEPNLPPTTPAPAAQPEVTRSAFNPTLQIENGTVVKGFSQVDENRLAHKLTQIGLRQRLLKVAIFRTGKVKMGLIKVQAGLADSGRIELRALEEDTVNCLRAAFTPDLDLEHVDFSAVVPGQHNADNDYHLPVFFVAADRSEWTNASQAKTPADVIAGLGVARYAPTLLRHAEDIAERGQFTSAAFTDPLMSDRWAELVAQAKTDLPIAAATPRDGVRIVRRGDRNLPRVALTIDDGPHPLITPLVLEALKQAGVKATFFIVGVKAEEYPELVRRIVAEGHELGNHTYSHARLTKLAPAQIWAEIKACDDVVYRITGVRMHFLRPPGGGYDVQALRVIQAAGYSLGLWTDNTGDWRRPSPQTITRNALRNIAPGGIILMHQGEPVSVEAIPMIVRGLRLAGLEPGTLSSITGENGRESVEKALENQVDEEMPGQDD